MPLHPDHVAQGLRAEVWLGGGYFGTVVLTGRYRVGPGRERLDEDPDGALHRAGDLRPEGSTGRLEA